MTARRVVRWLAGLVTLAVLVTAGFVVFGSGDDGTELTAHFTRATGLYEGDEVRVLGVTVGTVDSIEPGRHYVTVRFTVDHGVSIPAGATAAIVAQNLVTARFVQLSPAYTHGPTLHNGDVITKTAVPVEFDQVRRELTRLAKALAPTAGDHSGALGGAVRTADANLTGNAAQLNSMLHQLSLASDTLAASRGDLFGTVRGLQIFIHSLVRSDASVRSFSGQLNDISQVLDDNRSALAVALARLDDAVAQVGGFIKHNRTGLRTTVGALSKLAHTLAGKQYQLAELLHVAPTALSNFYNIVDPRYHAATGTLAASNFDDLAELVCTQIVRTGGVVQDCLSILQPLLDKIGLSKLPTSVRQAAVRGAEQAHTTPPSQTTTSTGPTLDGQKIGKTVRGLLGQLLPGLTS